MKGRDERNSETGLEADWINVHEDWKMTTGRIGGGGRERERRGKRRTGGEEKEDDKDKKKEERENCDLLSEWVIDKNKTEYWKE